jgi:hypothetical protein
MALFLLAVIEIILLEEASGSHVALVVPLWVLVCVFVGKICCPCFVDKHVDFGMGEFIFDKLLSFVDILFFLFASIFPVVAVASCVFIKKVGGRLMWKEPKRTRETSG